MRDKLLCLNIYNISETKAIILFVKLKQKAKLSAGERANSHENTLKVKQADER